MAKSLVIVESPTKARTIARFLDSDDYVVESSIGHIRDLPDSAKEIPESLKKQPWGRLGIDVEHDFKPFYVVPEEKKKQVKKLKDLLKDADRLYLATDEDREGESISWHLQEVLQPKVPTHRLVFHEITRDAIERALQSPRDIDSRLVLAQETRRVLDRLYGYQISPLLWRKVAPQLSAGRVQSVAVRQVVERERARMRFKPAEYWDLAGSFRAADAGDSANGGDDGRAQPFRAELIELDGKRLVSGRDFDDETGQLKQGKRQQVHLDEQGASALQARLGEAAWQVVKVERKPYTTNPPAPFTTSTLQQEASRKLSMGSRETMRVAQGLYERGYITYMRTDSTSLSEEAVKAARKQIGERYGKDYLPDKPRTYASTVKNAQEAHEAIRPAGEQFRLPESLRSELEAGELRLYDLIWKRTVACQMPPARGHRITLQLEGGDGEQTALFQATGKTIDFPGFLRAYVEGSDDPEAELGDQERVLPDLDQGDALRCDSLEPVRHETQPPARFTEASLIRELEKEGIGRPSTYASIIDTITRREYVYRKGTALVPTFTAFAVVQLMELYFARLVDVHFTADMEDALDAISRGEQDSLPYLRAFYEGTDKAPGLKQLLEAEIDARRACTIPLSEGRGEEEPPISVRVGRYGPFLERDGERASLPASMAPDELSLDRARELLRRGNQPDVLGQAPDSGRNVYVKEGRYGPYVQLGESGDEEGRKMKSLPAGVLPEEVTLDLALKLLSLPRSIGADPETGEDVVVDLGRYGPYARRGKETRSLPDWESLFTITPEEAQAIFAQEKRGARRGSTLLRELGEHPDSGEKVNLMSGRYGPYVTDGSVNASVPRGESPDELALERAVALLRERAAKGPAKGRRGGRKSAAASRENASSTTTAGKKGAASKSATSKSASTKSGGAKKSTAAKSTSKSGSSKSASSKSSDGKTTGGKSSTRSGGKAGGGSSRRRSATG